MLPPYLTDAEIADICRPLRQGAARIRYLQALGIPVHRRADGTPLVWRRDVERAQASGGTMADVRPSNEPRWARGA